MAMPPSEPLRAEAALRLPVLAVVRVRQGLVHRVVARVSLVLPARVLLCRKL